MNSLTCFGCALLIFSFVPGAHAHSIHKKTTHAPRPAASGIAHLLQGYYNQGNAAAMRKDLDGALRYFSPDYVIRDRQGNEIDLNETRFRLSALFDSAKSITSSTIVSSASQQGNIATALIHDSTRCVVINPKTDKKGVIAAYSVARDTWTHTQDGWMMTRSQQISSQETLNGKPVTDSDQMTPDPSQS